MQTPGFGKTSFLHVLQDLLSPVDDNKGKKRVPTSEKAAGLHEEGLFVYLIFEYIVAKYQVKPCVAGKSVKWANHVLDGGLSFGERLDHFFGLVDCDTVLERWSQVSDDLAWAAPYVKER